MENERFSLMTFNLAKDFRKKTMTVQDSLKLAADAGIPYVDVMRVGAKSVSEYQAAMAATGVQVSGAHGIGRPWVYTTASNPGWTSASRGRAPARN